MKPPGRSTLIKGRILASVITFLLLLLFLFLAVQCGLLRGGENREALPAETGLENHGWMPAGPLTARHRL